MTGSKTLELKGLIPSLEEDTFAYEQLAHRAMSYLGEIGLPFPEQPMLNGKPLIPTIPVGPNGPSLENLDETGLTNLYAQLVAYWRYVSAQYSVLEIQKAALKEKLDLTEAKIMLLLPPPEASKKTRARANQKVNTLTLQLLEVNAKMTLLEKIVSGASEEMKLVSREITIRTKERDNISRENNAGRFKPREGVFLGGKRIK
jgi:hypothetical protein